MHLLSAVDSLAIDEGFIGFDDLILTAQRFAVVGKSEFGHGLADAMAEEPCGFRAAFESALDLTDRDAFFEEENR